MGRGGKTARERERQQRLRKSIMYLTLLHRLRVPVIVRQVKTGRGEEEGKSEMAGLWSGNGHRQQRSAAFFCFFCFRQHKCQST